jgi:hypothetical protein
MIWFGKFLKRIWGHFIPAGSQNLQSYSIHVIMCNSMSHEAIYVPPHWYEAYKFGNRHYPQATFGIAALVGREVTNSLISGNIDLLSAVRSQFSREQFEDLKLATVRAHRAMGIPVMPTGMAQECEGEFDAEYWYNGTWSDIKRSFVRALAYLAADKHPFDVDTEIEALGHEYRNTHEGYAEECRIRKSYRAASPANGLAYEIMRERDDIENEYAHRSIEAFQRNEEYQRTLPVVTRMYAISAGVLGMKEAVELAIRRTQKFNNRKAEADDFNGIKGDNFEAIDYELYLIGMIRKELNNFAPSASISEERVIDFLNCITNYPKSTLKQKPRLIRLAN